MKITRNGYEYTMNELRKDMKYIYLGAFTEKGMKVYDKYYFHGGEKMGVKVYPKRESWKSFKIVEATKEERDSIADWLNYHRGSKRFSFAKKAELEEQRKKAEEQARIDRQRDYDRFRASD